MSFIPAIFVRVGGITMGFEKFTGNIPTSMQAALLKYSRWILSHMYRACLVFRPWIVNSTGSQPWHVSVKPPAARKISRDGIRLFAVSPIFPGVWVPRGIWCPHDFGALILWSTILSWVWDQWERDHMRLSLCYLACSHVCVGVRGLVEFDMDNECVRVSFVGFRAFCSCSQGFFF